MVNRSKQKGDREERDVVLKHREHGFEVERTLESGKRSDGSEPWDITLETPLGTLKGECKVKARGFKIIYDWFHKSGIDFLTIRQDRGERLYVLPEKVWFKLINSLQTSKNRVDLDD